MDLWTIYEVWGRAWPSPTLSSQSLQPLILARLAVNVLAGIASFLQLAYVLLRAVKNKKLMARFEFTLPTTWLITMQFGVLACAAKMITPEPTVRLIWLNVLLGLGYTAYLWIPLAQAETLLLLHCALADRAPSIELKKPVKYYTDWYLIVVNTLGILIKGSLFFVWMDSISFSTQKNALAIVGFDRFSIVFSIIVTINIAFTTVTHTSGWLSSHSKYPRARYEWKHFLEVYGLLGVLILCHIPLLIPHFVLWDSVADQSAIEPWGLTPIESMDLRWHRWRLAQSIVQGVFGNLTGFSLFYLLTRYRRRRMLVLPESHIEMFPVSLPPIT